MKQWLSMNKGKVGVGIALLAIILSVVYIGMPTYKKVVEERDSLKTKVTQLEQDKETIQNEYSSYKKNYTEDTVKIIEPIILPNGALALDGQGKAVYRTSITHKRNVAIQDEKSKQIIDTLTTRLVEATTEIERLKKTEIVKREIRRVMGILSSSGFQSAGIWIDAQTFGPLWTGAEVITPDIKNLWDVKNMKVYLRVGIGF
jgi:hypothetical protein